MNTEIITITDRSGSMETIRRDVIGGYNRFLAEQQALPGAARLTYTQFDTQYDVIYQGMPLAAAPQLDDKTFVPRGSTALLDAIGRTLVEQGKRIHDENWAERVIVAIITDGAENASREYNRAQIKEMIAHAQQHDWHFVFLAANQDAFAEAASYGISAATTRNFTASAAGVKAAYADTSLLVGQLRGAA